MVMKNGTSLDVSARRKDEFLKKLTSFNKHDDPDIFLSGEAIKSNFFSTGNTECFRKLTPEIFFPVIRMTIFKCCLLHLSSFRHLTARLTSANSLLKSAFMQDIFGL